MLGNVIMGNEYWEGTVRGKIGWDVGKRAHGKLESNGT